MTSLSQQERRRAHQFRTNDHNPAQRYPHGGRFSISQPFLCKFRRGSSTNIGERPAEIWSDPVCGDGEPVSTAPVPMTDSPDVAADRLTALFSEWARHHGGTVLKVARAYTRTPEDRQDLAQEILLQVWRSLPQFRQEASLATWCYRVALNTALGWRRRDRRLSARRQPVFDLQELTAAGPDSSERAGKRELVDRLYAAIHQMPPADSALVLLYLDGLSYRQMSDVLGISESHVGVKLNRARKALTEQMGGGDVS